MPKAFQTLALALMIVLLALPAAAATFTPDRVDMAAAKREGTVSWYTSTPIETAQRIANQFEKQTGIKVELFRSGGSAVMSRFMQEQSANTHAADVITTSDPAAAAALAKQGVFVAFKPENYDKIPAEVKDKDGYWIAQRLNLLAIAVRGDKVKPADRPKTWSDLTQPRYKSLEVMPDPSFTSLQLVAVDALAKKLGWSFYERLQEERHLDRARSRASRRHAQARRARDRGRGTGFVRRRGPDGRRADLDRLSDGRRVCDRVADGDRQGRSQSQRRESVRRVHDRRRGAERVRQRGHLRRARRRGRRPPAARGSRP